MDVQKSRLYVIRLVTTLKWNVLEHEMVLLGQNNKVIILNV